MSEKERKQQRVNEIAKSLVTELHTFYSQWRSGMPVDILARRYGRAVSKVGYSMRSFFQSLDSAGMLGLIYNRRGRLFLLPRKIFEGMSLAQLKEVAEQSTPKTQRGTDDKTEPPTTIAAGRKATDKVFSD